MTTSLKQNFIVQQKARGKKFTIKECLKPENYISVVPVFLVSLHRPKPTMLCAFAT